MSASALWRSLALAAAVTATPSLANTSVIIRQNGNLGMKRGISFDDQYQDKAASFVNHPDIGWVHNWSPDPLGLDIQGQEFVPRLWAPLAEWDEWHRQRWSLAVLDNTRSKYLLSYNEPDLPRGVGGTLLPAARAAALWPTEINSRGQNQDTNPKFFLGSPGVSSAGMQWMQDFMNICNGACDIDFFDVHYYGTCNNSRGFQKYLLEYKDKIVRDSGKPIWVTEFGVENDSCWVEQERDWIYNAIRWMDAQGWIKRYSYFSGIGKDCGGSLQFLGCDGQWTCQAHAFIDSSDDSDPADLPETVENFKKYEGVSCSNS